MGTMQFIVLIGTQPQEAAGPFTSAAAADRLADDIRATGVRAQIIPLANERTVRDFYSAVRP